MSWPWRNWSWHGKWGEEKKESETTRGYSWQSQKKETQQSEQTGEITDQELEATVVTKVNLQKRKQDEPEPQDSAATKAALRARIFAKHGASTLTNKDLETVEEENAHRNKKKQESESSTKRTKPRGSKTKTASEDESTAVGSEMENDDDLSEKQKTLMKATKKAPQKYGSGFKK